MEDKINKRYTEVVEKKGHTGVTYISKERNIPLLVKT